MQEEWRDIDGFEGLYMVSNLGRIKSLLGWNGHNYVRRERIIKGWVQNTRYGYKRKLVALYRGGKTEIKKVHRIVAGAFIPNPNNFPVVNHIDLNPLNNNVQNLEWCTAGDNVRHSIKNGKGNMIRLNEDIVVSEYKNGSNLSLLAIKYGVSRTPIKRILKNNNVAIDRHRGIKYNVNLEDLLDDFKHGATNKELADKYSCSYDLIATRRYQFKKKGMIK